ncbi:helix-turn-helix domain-containing protein [Streptomyces sp. NPDC060223]|uniref:helix-turn-helix domain-containing protein n=1 Tax=unclassified Streptomyces TaxID=2593676 RepID=UPI00362B1FBA
MSGEALPLSGRQPRAVRNALSVLQQVAQAGPGVTAKEISARLRLAPATTYRLLNVLVEEEYLVRMPDLRGFALGRRVSSLAPPRPVPPEVPAAAHAVVARLRDRVRFGVHLAGLTDGRVHLTDPDPDHPPADNGLLRELARIRDDDGAVVRRFALGPHQACLVRPVHSAANGRLAAALAVCGTAGRIEAPDDVLIHHLNGSAEELTLLVV